MSGWNRAVLGLLMCCAWNALADAPPARTAAEVLLEEPTGELALADALALALLKHPDLAAHGWDIRVAEARALQARVRPNPELSLEVEEVGLGGGGAASDSAREFSVAPGAGLGLGVGRSRTAEEGGALGTAEVTVALARLVELGGKRAARMAVAAREREVAGWDYEVARAEVLAATAQRFYAVLAAQERVRLTERLLTLAQEAHGTIRLLVEAGKVSLIEQSRSLAELTQVELERDRAAGALEATRVLLAGQWGSATPVFAQAAGTLPGVYTLPPLEALRDRVMASPQMARWVSELAMRDAVVALERAHAKPDLTLSVGFRTAGVPGTRESGWSASTEDGLALSRGGTDGERVNSLLFGVSVPLPLSNRNRGRIAETEHLSAKAGEQRRAAEAAFVNALAVQRSAAETLAREVAKLEGVLLPTAREAFEAVQEGYRQGKFGLIDVLQAERTLFDAERQLADARAEFQQTVVEIERITGMPVEPTVPVAATDAEVQP